ncbi:MAG: hypothetical protein Kow0069_16840 [Promethearchaeota archaeon]
MVQSVVILCDRSPVGTNVAAEALRIGAGLAGLGEMLDCKVVYSGDAVLLLAKAARFEAVGQDPVGDALEMAELADLPIWVLDEALEDAGLTREDLVDYEALEVVDVRRVAGALAEADASFRY